MVDTFEDTKTVLHPRQTNELRETRAQLEGILSAPAHIRGQLQDNGAHVQKQIDGVDRMLSQAPKPIDAQGLGSAIKKEKELRAMWLNGIPTQAEMRRNPPGAADKHIAWEKKHKRHVLQWKNLRRRLHASGVSDHGLSDENDISNIEKFRPAGGSGEMNFDNAQIAGKEYHLPPPGAGPVVVMSAKDESLLQEISPKTADKMAFLSNEQRAEVLDLVRSFGDVGSVEVKTEVVKAKAAKKTAKRKEKYAESELCALRTRCKELGINTYGAGKQAMRDKIAEAGG